VKRSDAALLRAARTDPHAFRELYDRHADGIYRFHLTTTRNADAALDLTAETFVRSRNDAGTQWECYIGEAAVKQKIISQSFLEEVQTTPAVR
jgi:hypothetical protein